MRILIAMLAALPLSVHAADEFVTLAQADAQAGKLSVAAAKLAPAAQPNVNKERLYINLTCLPHEQPQKGTAEPTFSGFLVIEKGDLVRDSRGYYVKGNEPTTQKTQIDNEKCRSHYWVGSNYYENGDFRYYWVERKRDWNAFILLQNDRTVVRGCSISSPLTIYRDKSAFEKNVKESLAWGSRCNYLPSSNDSSCGGTTVSDMSCVSSELP